MPRPSPERRRVERRPARRVSRHREPPDWAIGIDFGHARDYTAIALMQRVEPSFEDNEQGVVIRPLYHLRGVKRFPLRTETPQVIAYLQRLMDRRTLRDRVALLADGTGLGAPIIQEMRRYGVRVTPLIITAGGQAHGTSVPKRDLVMRVKLLLEQRRLRFSTELKLHHELAEEFQNFEVRSTANGNATYSAASGYHDDIIMAISFCCFYFERRPALTRLRVTLLPRATTSRPSLNLSGWAFGKALPPGF